MKEETSKRFRRLPRNKNSTNFAVPMFARFTSAIQKYNHATEIMKRSFPHKAKIIWGARVDKEQKWSVSVMAVVTGVEARAKNV